MKKLKIKTEMLRHAHVPYLSALEMSHDKALYKSTVTLTLTDKTLKCRSLLF